jgi:hypothetical protein
MEGEEDNDSDETVALLLYMYFVFIYQDILLTIISFQKQNMVKAFITLLA